MIKTTIHSYGSFISKNALITGEKNMMDTKIANTSSLIHEMSSVDRSNTAPVKIPSASIKSIFDNLSIFHPVKITNVNTLSIFIIACATKTFTQDFLYNTIVVATSLKAKAIINGIKAQP